ncbi:MAG: glycoside hydrolase family 127 protein, partial [Oscillospiraceae bacterium]|nr:glycoside hydrolase family 127 protein [Oscillospiraceae bacterium]
MRPKRFVALCVALAVLLPAQTALFSSAAAVRAGNANYYSNQGALVPDAFAALPLSAVRASGWLENQLLLQKNGLTGHMHLFNEYNAATSRWLGAASGEAWERGPYYMRGLVALAFTLDDETLKAEAMQWIEAVLGSQRANGSFGPTSLGDWWPNMPVLLALRDYYGYTEHIGAPDARVLPFMEAYFHYEADNLSRYRLTNWADARGGDNVDSVYWLYNRLYDAERPEDTEWLLRLGETLIGQTNNWADIYNNSTARYHVVNTSQGLKTPAVHYQYNKDAAWRDAAANGILHWGIDHGRIDGLPNADEAARDNRATRGTETCGIVENLLSMEITERILGDAWIGDYIERVAYNALPAATTPDGTGHVYFVQQNQVLATMGSYGFANDHGDSVTFGAPSGYDCCFSNYHMGWAKFVQSMWMATYGGGLAVTAYGPNQVTAKVADGKTARFSQKTDYPFKDTVALSYGGDEAAFELKLRIPAWAVDPVVTVNGAVCEGVVSGAYYTVDRVWTYGDAVNLVFPSEITASTWYNNSVGIEKGALIYGLKIDEEWRRLDGTDGNDLRELKVSRHGDHPTREVYAASRWNYGLVVDYDDPAAGFAVEEAAQVPLQPFSAETAPVTLKATGQIVPEWTLDGNMAGPQPFITPYDETMTEPVELIPYGAGRLRVSQFPRIGAPSETVVRRDGRAVRQGGAAYTEFDNVVVPAAENYRLIVRGTGAGRVLVNSRYSEEIDLSGGAATVSNLKTKTSGDFQFRHEQLNNLRFTDGLTVSSVEVVLVGRAIGDLVVGSVGRTEAGVRLTTNLSAQETPYRVVYGTESGVYRAEVSGFTGGAAQITGLDPEATYYVKIRAAIGGAVKESEEYALPPVSGGGELAPNPNAPAAAYDGFGPPEDMRRDWAWISPNGTVSLAGDDPARIRFERSTNHKAYLSVAGAAYWTDYVAEVRLSVDDIARNNSGLMLRATDLRDGADGYNGYFVGIGRYGPAAAGTSHVVIGYADGGWHDLRQVARTIVPGQIYTLKVVAYGERFAVYLDDELVTTFEDSRFVSGTIGLRSYDEAFTAYNASVRPVTREDLRVFAPEAPYAGPEPNAGAPDARYTGFVSAAAYRAEWQAYGSAQAIAPVEDSG